MDDLEDAMEEEDSGVPTPPEDPCDNRINDHVAAILPINPVPSNPVTGNISVLFILILCCYFVLL